MGNKIVWSTRSRTDYDNLLEYLNEEWGKEITKRIILELEEKVLKIQDNPEHYPIFNRKKRVRRCVSSPQTSIFFKIHDGYIEIVTLFDNRQSPRKLKF